MPRDTHSGERFVLSLCAQAGSVRTEGCAELLTLDLTTAEFGITDQYYFILCFLRKIQSAL